MNFKKVIANENAAIKATLVINGKFNESAIMREAWARARRMATNVAGAQACEFFAQALKATWEIAKA